MAIKEWEPFTQYKQGDCVVVSDGAGGYFGDANNSKTWLLCCVGTGASPDTTPNGVSGAVKTRLEWATLFEGNTTDETVSEATVMPATVQANLSGPDGNIRWALGVAYFLDTSASVSGNGSYASPYSTASSISAGQITSQDGTNTTRQLFIKRGTTVLLTSTGAQWLGRGSSRKMNAKISDYGSDLLAKPILDASLTTSGLAGVLISKASTNPARYVTIENFVIKRASGSGVSIFLGTSDASIAHTDISVLNVDAVDNGESGIQALTGGAVDRTTYSSNLLIKNCTASGNGVYGIAAREWWSNITIDNCVVTNNGINAPSGAYGISTIGNYLTITGTNGTEWTNVSGTVWRRTISRTNPVIVGLWTNPSSSQRILSLGTYGSLASDYQIAISGTSLEVRLGAGDDPNNLSSNVRACFAQCQNIVIKNCEANETHDYRTGTSRFDGDGIGIDHFSKNILVTRCKASRNGGCGILSNIPENLVISNCIFDRNGSEKQAGNLPGANLSINNPITAVTVSSCSLLYGVGLDAGAGIRVYSPNGGTVTPYNTLIAFNEGNSVFAGNSSYIGVGQRGNAVYSNGNSYPASVVELTGSITENPLLSNTYYPRIGSPLIYAGAYFDYTRDLDNIQRWNPPTIGAYEFIEERGFASPRGIR